MIVDIKKGDLIKRALDGKYDVIVHGCNCFCRMGAGIALQIKTILPEAYEADLATKAGDKSKLGTYTKADIAYEYGTEVKRQDMLTIVNAYTQYGHNPKDKPVDYDAIRKIFAQLNEDYADMNVGIPMIGAGLAGGDWNRIASIIDEVTPKLDVHLVEYQK